MSTRFGVPPRGDHNRVVRVWLVLVVLILSACSGGDVVQPVVDAPDDHPVRLQLEWFVAALDSGTVPESDFEARFSADFKARVSFEESFLPVLADMSRVAGEWRLIGLDLLSDVEGEGVLAAAGERMRVTLRVEAESPNRIVDLIAQPVMLTLPPDSYEDVVDPLRRYGSVAFLAAEFTDGDCVAGFGVDETRPVPLGSATSLLVAAVVTDQVHSGELTWDTPVTIAEEWRSHPSGILGGVVNGDVRTVAELLMLSVADSDNGATDHLIGLLGRDTVESKLAEFGSAVGPRSLPFLTTRELASLKIGGDRSVAKEYAEASEEQRRILLTGLNKDLSNAVVPRAPVFVDEIEWFASPQMLCTLLTAMYQTSAETDMEPLAAAFTKNQGIAPVPGIWDEVWFVGGSEPGVLAAIWLTVSGSQVYVTIGSVSNADANFPAIDPSLRLAAGRDLGADQS